VEAEHVPESGERDTVEPVVAVSDFARLHGKKLQQLALCDPPRHQHLRVLDLLALGQVHGARLTPPRRSYQLTPRAWAHHLPIKELAQHEDLAVLIAKGLVEVHDSRVSSSAPSS